MGQHLLHLRRRVPRPDRDRNRPCRRGRLHHHRGRRADQRRRLHRHGYGPEQRQLQAPGRGYDQLHYLQGRSVCGSCSRPHRRDHQRQGRRHYHRTRLHDGVQLRWWRDLDTRYGRDPRRPCPRHLPGALRRDGELQRIRGHARRYRPEHDHARRDVQHERRYRDRVPVRRIQRQGDRARDRSHQGWLYLRRLVCRGGLRDRIRLHQGHHRRHDHLCQVDGQPVHHHVRHRRRLRDRSHHGRLRHGCDCPCRPDKDRLHVRWLGQGHPRDHRGGRDHQGFVDRQRLHGEVRQERRSGHRDHARPGLHLRRAEGACRQLFREGKLLLRRLDGQRRWR